jgi:ATP-dependent Lon protease
VSWYSDVFDIVFASLDREAAKHAWEAQLARPQESQTEEESGERDEKQDEREDEEKHGGMHL